MRICDWSSDVFSSYLRADAGRPFRAECLGDVHHPLDRIDDAVEGGLQLAIDDVDFVAGAPEGGCGVDRHRPPRAGSGQNSPRTAVILVFRVAALNGFTIDRKRVV